ncbi:MAG: acyl-CoA dehydrogenase [Rhodospirillaceae bacterium]|jgi:butyryl-CoA dehydrogenase|nr:acyl-CoA dehydrogenase [Rhodospirillaceae bacterium]MBT4046063.1 acyl-CoA dehydrogenase [Rhodospirillaceae bacterium]MBT4688120.1 acyl-CoA dehydrogenase [Rhodospirillaceae bacterium]MBT5080287.1 acyl-CoA dehydrogenase [Rhodospirillaceae bacterium]MBT5525014.1 acyl-CoA dehydrogenase [Rhodospirillaceae bacterium]
MILNEEQRMIQDTARRFAQAEILPNIKEWDRTGAPDELFRKMGQAGLMGICIDPEWGGAGADFVSYVLAMEEISAADGGIANLMAANNSPVLAALREHGTAAQKRRFFPKLTTGEMIGCIALTEPHTGSDAAAIRTRAERRGDYFVLNGHKSFITAGRRAGVVMIVAVTDPDAGKRGISTFLTPTDNPGYKVLREEAKLGHRTNDTCAIAFEDMMVPATDLLGAEGRGLGIALANLSAGRIGVAAQAVGGARAAFEAALNYAQEREAFGKPIIEHQAVAFRLADMATKIEVGRQMYLHAAQIHDSGAPSLKEASMAKLFASDMAETVASDALQTFGGYGYLEDFPVAKILRDVRVYRIYEGTNDIQKIVISRALASS